MLNMLNAAKAAKVQVCCLTTQQKNAALEAMAAEILNEKACFSLRDLAVNGSDLLAAGCAPGKAVGTALDDLLNAVIDGVVPNDKAALLAHYAAQKGE